MLNCVKLMLVVLPAVTCCPGDNFPLVTPCSYEPSVAYKIFAVEDKYDCAKECSLDLACKSFSFQGPGSCHLNKVYLKDENCNGGQFQHYVRACRNDGIIVSEKCKCAGGYIGDHCERLMRDCTEGFASEMYEEKEEGEIYLVKPELSPEPIRVWCWMKYDGRTYLMTRKDVSPQVNFTRTWEEYKEGFGDLDGNFYLGNEAIHFLTHKSDLCLVEEVNDRDGNYGQFGYENVMVRAESSKYSITWGNTWVNDYIPITSQQCIPNKNTKFTTIDQDNDSDPGKNCGEIQLSGWWFDNCGPCNPTGRIQGPSDNALNPGPTYLSHVSVTNKPVMDMYLFLMPCPDF